ncbi:unnamed protein product [Lampetra fluviatilis]
MGKRERGQEKKAFLGPPVVRRLSWSSSSSSSSPSSSSRQPSPRPFSTGPRTDSAAPPTRAAPRPSGDQLEGPRVHAHGGPPESGAGGWVVRPFGLKLDPLLSNLLRATESIASGRLRNRLPAVAAAGRPRGGETPPGLSSRRPARRGTRQSPPEPRAASLRSPDRSPVSLRRSPVSHGRSPRARTEDRRRPLAGDGHVRATVTCERDDDDDFEI